MKSNKIKRFALEDLLTDKSVSILWELEELGAIIVKGIDKEPIFRLYNEIELFFNSPQETKTKYNFGNDFWGYFIENEESSKSCRREIFDINHTYFYIEDFDTEELRYINAHSIPQGMWPTYQDFPNFQIAFTTVYDYWFELCEKLLQGVSQGFLTTFKYHTNKEAKFKIREHQDNQYVIAFAPIGEPLEIFIENNWTNENISDTEALIIKPPVKHRVQNLTNKERYSVTFAYPLTAM